MGAFQDSISRVKREKNLLAPSPLPLAKSLLHGVLIFLHSHGSTYGH